MGALAAVLAAGASSAAGCGGSDATPSSVAPPVDAGTGDGPRVPTPVVDDPDTGEGPVTGPTLLSQAGLYSDFASRTVAPGLMAYAPRYEFWVDGAQKSRWLYLPPGTKIDTSSINHFMFPVGTKVFKEFRFDGKPVETRLLMKVKPGSGNLSWFEMAYVWKADGSDAVAAPLGQVDADGTTHKVPSQVDCANCHGGVSDVLIGVSAIQLSDPAGNVLTALGNAGRLSQPVPSVIEVPGSGVVKDALAYLHANCGHCHNSEAKDVSTQSRMRLRVLVGQSTVEETGAYTTTVGTVMKHVIPGSLTDAGAVTDVVVKGDPDRSGLWVRMGRRDDYGMPPAGTQRPDPTGLDTVRQWILGWQ